jgi:hypothetical protein
VDKTYVLDVSWLSVVVGFFIPLLVGVVAKSTASSRLKACLNLGLSAIAGAVTTIITNKGAFLPREFVSSVALTWVTSMGAYLGFLKPSGVAAKVSNATAGVGVTDNGNDKLDHGDMPWGDGDDEETAALRPLFPGGMADAHLAAHWDELFPKKG